MTHKTYQYHWRHVPSRVENVRAFDKTQHRIFGYSDIASEEIVRALIDYLLWEWNREQPDTWKYWITEEDVCRK